MSPVTRASSGGAAGGGVTEHEAAPDPHAQYQTASEVDARIALVVDAAPAALDTLNEIAAALGDDADFAGTITGQLAGKADTGHSHAYASDTHNHDAAYAPTHSHPYAATSHAHVDADLPAGLARDAEVAAAYSPLGHTHSYEASGAVATHAAAADPHTGYQKESEKDAANGYAGLDANVRVPTARLGSGTANSTVFLRGDQTWAAPPAGGGGTPSDTVASETSFGVSAAAGSATAYARGDHTHGTPTNPVTAHEAAGDPHPGYLTAAEGNAAYATAGHTHAGAPDARLTVFAKTADQAVTGTAVTDVTSLAFAVEANSTYIFSMWVDITASAGTSPTHNYQFTGPAGITRFMAKRTQMTSATAQSTSTVAALATGFGAGATVANIKNIFEGVIVTGGTAGTVQLRVTPAGTNPTSTIARGSGGYAMKAA